MKNKLILSLCALFLFASAGFSQASEKKINKSPAVLELQVIERNLRKLESLNEKEDKEIIEEYYDNYSRRLDSINTNLEIVKSKDPKWKTKRYYQIIPTYSTRLKSLEPLYKKHLRRMELEAKIEIILDDRTSDCSFGVYSPRDMIGNRSFGEKLACGNKFKVYYINKYKAQETLSMIKELEELNPRYFAKSHAKVGFRKFYIEKLDGKVAENIQQIQTYASAISEKTDFEGYMSDYKLYLEYLSEMNETMAKIDPKQEVEAKLNEAKINEAKNHIQDLLFGDITISEDRIGKIFFTDGDVERSDFDNTIPISEWDFNGPLNFRFFMEKAAMEFDSELGETGLESHRYAYLEVDVYVAGKLIKNYDLIQFRDYKNMYRLDRSFRKEQDLREMVAKELANLKYGKHEIRLDLYLSRDEVEQRSSLVATGSININYTSAIASKIKANSDICLPKSGMNNSNLANKCLGIINRDKDKGDSFFESTDKFTIVRIVSDEWWISTNEYSGVPKSRSILVLVAGKDKDGNCLKMVLGMKQDYAGAGNYGALYVDSSSGRDMIPCLCF